MSKKKVSAAQLAANRANGKNSTGPRTAEGKAKVSANALKHGLLSDLSPARIQLHGSAAPEEHRLYEAFLAAFTMDLAPSGPLETQLVQRLASLNLRLTRITRIESGMFAHSIDNILQYDPGFRNEDVPTLQEFPTDRLLAEAYHRNSRSLNLLSYYESRLAREYHRTLQQLRQVQQTRAQLLPVATLEHSVPATEAQAPCHSADSAAPLQPISNEAPPLREKWNEKKLSEKNSTNKPNFPPTLTAAGTSVPPNVSPLTNNTVDHASQTS